MTKNMKNIPERNKVIVYKPDLLPLSETFIKEQVYHLKSWQGILFGENHISDGIDLSDVQFRTINAIDRIVLKIKRRILPWPQMPTASILKMLKRENAKIVHVHFGVNAVLQGWSLSRALKIPMIVTLHGADISVFKERWESGEFGADFKMYPKNLLRIAEAEDVHFIAVSESIKERALDFGIPDRKITVSYIGVDTGKFLPARSAISSKKDVLFVGRLVEKKGCIYLLKAFESIQDNFFGSKLVIVGDGPDRAMLEDYAKQRQVRAEFKGSLDRNRVRELMLDSRIFCLPSITAENGDAEGLPIVILEAQSSGIPVVTSAKGGATEGIVNGKTGFAHKEKDIKAIEMALNNLLRDDTLTEKFSLAAREHILEKMDIIKCIEHLESIYSEHSKRVQQNSGHSAG